MVGQRVYHKNYGKGTVKSLSPNGIYFNVRFDNEPGKLMIVPHTVTVIS